MVRRTFLLILKASFVSAWLTSTLDARADDTVSAVPECIGANERALDLRQQGRLLDSRRELAACAAARCPDAIQQACRGRMTDLNSAVPSIVFEVKDEAGLDMMDVQLVVDGQPAGTAGVTARQVDPGRHVFRFEAPGRPAVERVVVLREGEKERRESVQFGPVALSQPAVNAREASATASSPVGPHSPATSSALRTGAWITGGVGLATMALGGALAIGAKLAYEGAPDCSGTLCRSEDGIGTRNRAMKTGDAATVVTLAGAVLAATGVVLWIIAPSSREVSGRAPLRVGLTLRGAIVGGGFLGHAVGAARAGRRPGRSGRVQRRVRIGLQYARTG